MWGWMHWEGAKKNLPAVKNPHQPNQIILFILTEIYKDENTISLHFILMALLCLTEKHKLPIISEN